MTRQTQSRVKYLRLALQEAVRAGDREAAKRLTKLVVKLIGGDREELAQKRAG